MTRRRFRKRASGLYVPGPWTPTRLSTLGSHDARGQFVYHVGDPGPASIIQPSYIASFPMPTNDVNGIGPGDGCQAAVYNPANNSLIVNCNDTTNQAGRGFFAEFAIPDRSTWVPGNNLAGGSTNIAEVVAAGRPSYIQVFADITGGIYANDPVLGTPDVHGRLRGVTIDPDGNLVTNIYNNYGDSSRSQFIRHGLNFSVNDARGLISAWDPNLVADFQSNGYTLDAAKAAAVRIASGMLAVVPSALISAVGGSLVTGIWDLSGASQSTSFGPTVSSLSHSDLGLGTPATSSALESSIVAVVKSLAVYPFTHQTLGEWGGPAPHRGLNGRHEWWSWGDQIGGIFFLGSNIVFVMVYGRGHAINPFTGLDTETNWYGPGVPNSEYPADIDAWAKNGTVVGFDWAGGNPSDPSTFDPNYFAYDAAGNATGPHGWPYGPRMIVLPIATALAAANPWDVVPASQFDFALPFGWYNGTVSESFAIAPDYGNELLYVIQRHSVDSSWPLANVFDISGN